MISWLREFLVPDQVVELRALDVPLRPNFRAPAVSGYFDADHLAELVDHAQRLTEVAKGVYFTMNPLNRDLLSRRHKRIDSVPLEMATDKDVLRRRWLLVDVDPQRISGVSATDAEKLGAWEKILEIRRYLQEHGWPEPVLADSGNGYHLLYHVDLPTQDGDLVKRVLLALAEKFDDSCVKVDRTVFNPSRITKFYGTCSRKGDDTPERPHSLTGVLDVPSALQAVPQHLLEALAAQAPAPGEPAKKKPSAEPECEGDTVQERARAYLERMRPAIAGEHGHDRTFHAACVLTHGFALTVEEALPLLQIYNLKCQPPWTNEELLHKLEDAAKKEGPRGYLLGSPRTTETPSPSGFEASFVDSAALE
jgi:hypothetical protein